MIKLSDWITGAVQVACLAVLIGMACSGCGGGQEPEPAAIPNTAHGACAGSAPPPYCRPGGG